MTWYERFDDLAAQRLPGLEIWRDQPMAERTSFRIGGPARRLVCPRSGKELAALLELAEGEKWPTLLLGNGSNLLVADEGLDRLVIHTGGLSRLEAGADGLTLEAEAGVSLARLAEFACRQGLTGLEFAHGIPGSLGGGVYMNAGAYGGELCQVLESAVVHLPGRGTVRLTNAGMNFGYRRSLLMDCPGGTVLSARFRLTAGDQEAIRERMRELSRRRREKQPLEYPSAGSVFKRPEGHFAGGLIEQCGLKGCRIGGAQVSEKHAGFIINTGGASCADVLALIGHIQRTVEERTGVRLEPEIRVLR